MLETARAGKQEGDIKGLKEPEKQDCLDDISAK